MDRLRIEDGALAVVERGRDVRERPKMKGRFKVEVWRKGKLVHDVDVTNGITDVGMNFLLDQVFRNQSGVAQWYIGLVDNAGFSAFANADTMGSHAGWAEFTTYSEGARQAWTTVAASGRSITNTTAATFTMSASGTLHGIFVTSSTTLGGSSGTLWSTGALAANLPVSSSDVVKITYTVSG